MRKILVVGQTPPPVHGQALMIERLVHGRFTSMEVVHVRMAFSESLETIGRLRIGKLFHLFMLIWKIWLVTLREKPDVLYYPPSGPNLIPILRDMILLVCTRHLFEKVVFHFHASGVSDYLKESPVWFQQIAKIAYGRPDAAILLSRMNPRDGAFLKAKREYVVPYGIEDDGKRFLPLNRRRRKTANILFVGLLKEDKGIMLLLKGASLLKREGLQFTVTLVGEFHSRVFQNEVMDFIRRSSLMETVRIAGKKTGDEKWKTYRDSDIFCFPSHFASESFGLVLLEAMMFELPIVTTNWRGIPEVVSKDCGFTVPALHEYALFEKLHLLVKSASLRAKLGRNGRKRFLRMFTLDRHLDEMESILSSI